jgi:hypothetical protein
MDLPKLYVGTMNDCAFLIDRPARPAPADSYPLGGDPETRVVAKLDYPVGEVVAWEIVRRCNAFPVMLAALRMLAGDPGLTAGANDVVAGALEAAGEDWRLAECLNGRR